MPEPALAWASEVPSRQSVVTVGRSAQALTLGKESGGTTSPSDTHPSQSCSLDETELDGGAWSLSPAPCGGACLFASLLDELLVTWRSERAGGRV